MSDVIRKTPYVSPDTLRAKLHMDQKLFNAHTSKTAFHEHSNQTYNVSHMENWGAEMLFETRKMKMHRPPLGDIHLYRRFEEYFELKYDDNVNTYEQENAVMCLLKENSLIDGKTLYVTFENVTQMILPRAISHSEQKIFPHIVWKTKTPPKLHIEGSVDTDTIDLIAYSDDDKLGEVTYWFCTTSTADLTGTNNSEFYERNLLDEQHCHDGMLRTLPIQSWGEGLPFVWLTFENFNTLPKIALENNIGADGHPILTFGSDGNGHHYVYLGIWGKQNYPEARDPADSDWFIRLHSRLPFTETTDETMKLTNVDHYITSIEFVHCKNSDPYHEENYLDSFIINLPSKNARFKFITREDYGYPKVDTIWGFHNWGFYKPLNWHWDYDGMTYANKVYAQYNRRFTGILEEIGNRPWMQPFLEVIPNTTNNPITYLWEKNSITSGMHVDYTTDYSMHGVMKKHGTIFNLGDFDGLPPYYYYDLPRETHRAHVELYHVKDVPNGPTNHAMDKRVATLLVDAAIPQNEIPDILKDMKAGIVYDLSAEYPTYHTKKDNVLTILNVKSDIGYGSREEFGDVTDKKYEQYPPFIYHGNRSFSLGVIGYDPELEYGRVYYLSNDTIAYDNNEISPLKKPPRTMARIADIPTDTSQLVAIKGKAPTLVLDEQYQRTEVSYTYDDFSKLWNSHTLVKNGAKVFFKEEYPYYDPTVARSYDSQSDYVFTGKSVVTDSQHHKTLPDNIRIGFTIDQAEDYLYNRYRTTQNIELFEGDQHICGLLLKTHSPTQKIVYLTIQKWYVDIDEKSVWHANKIILSADFGAGNSNKAGVTIPNFKMSVYLLDQMSMEDWESVGVDFDRNPLDYELTYQWLNAHYGTPQNLEYCLKNRLHLCREIEADITNNTHNEWGYLWQIQNTGTGYMIGDVIQCYMGGKICRGTITGISNGGSVTKISMTEPDDPEFFDVPYGNFGYGYDLNIRSILTSTTLIQKQYNSMGNGLTLLFTVSPVEWADAHDNDEGGLFHPSKLMALQYDAYGNLWIVTPSIKRTKEEAMIPHGDIIVPTSQNHEIIHTVVWNKTYQLTGEYIDMNMYNYYSLDDFYKYTVNTCMMKRLFETLSSYSGITDGCVYSPYITDHTSILTLPQDYGDAYPSTTEYLCDNMFSNGLLREDSYYVLREGEVEDEPVYYVNWYECSDIWGYGHTNITFPRNHKAIIKPGTRKACRLLFQEGDSTGVNLYDHTITKHHQSAILLYLPDASSFPVYQKYYHGMTQRISDRPFLFTDFDRYGYYEEENSIYEIRDGSVKLKYDVLKYNGDHIRKPSEDVIMEEYLEEAYEAYKAAHPAFEDEDDEEYITRLMMGWTLETQREWLYNVAGQQGKDILYSPSVNDVNRSLRLLRQKGDIVGTNFDRDTNTYEPMGEQPTGLSIPLTTRVYQKQYHFNTSPENIIESTLQFFFKIPDEVESLNGFRLKTTDGDDISKYTMLLYKNKLYAFDDRDPENNKWISIQRRKHN